MRDLDPQAMALAFDGLDCGTESFLAEEVRSERLMQR
ncbi:hypothetical protein ACVW0Q_002183 [Thermostichus sp. MS-CIW-21]|jgi:hypothetical protein